MRRLVRFLLRSIKRIVVLLTVLPFLGLVKVAKYVHVSQFISLIPLRFGEQVRYEFYRRTLAHCGKNVTISFGTIISYPDITIGDNVWLGSYNNVGHADIGDYVITARNCHFTSGNHPFDRTDIPIMKQQGFPGRVRVGPDVWLGSGVVVIADIHHGCVIGAGSVVTHPIPPMSVAVGSPARVIRTRGLDEQNPVEVELHNVQG